MSKADKTSIKKNDEAPPENVSVGVMLQQRREERGLGIQQISKEICVSVSNLLAIENENYSRLPADTFIRGQIVLYAKYLGLDGTETARAFFLTRDQTMNVRRKGRGGKPPASLSAKKLAEPAQVSSATFAGILLLLIVVSVTSFCMYTGWNPFAYFMKPEQPVTMPYGEVMNGEDSEQKSTATETEEAVAPQKSTVSYSVTAVFSRDTGVEVVIDGQEPVIVQGRKDSRQQWLADTSIQLSFEYPDSAEITVNGSALSFPTREQEGKATLLLPEDLPVD